MTDGRPEMPDVPIRRPHIERTPGAPQVFWCKGCGQAFDGETVSKETLARGTCLLCRGGVKRRKTGEP